MIARTVVVIATALRPRKHGSVGQQAGLYTMRIAPRHVLRGAAPVRRGDPGYARHLDRDGDGVGCE